MIQIKNSNIAKSGRVYSITVPAAFIKNGLVDPSKQYNITLELIDESSMAIPINKKESVEAS